MDKPPKDQTKKSRQRQWTQLYKPCAKCKELKYLAEFNKCKQNTFSGSQSYCRTCQRIIDLKYYTPKGRCTFFGPKLQQIDIIDIRADRASGMKMKDIAKAFDVGVDHVSRIVRGKAWGHVK